jgi:hypothetical protein
MIKLQTIWKPFHPLHSLISSFIFSIKYRLDQKSVNWLVIVQLNTLEICLLLTEFIKIVRNVILDIQCTTHNSDAVLQIDCQVQV